MGGLSRWFQSNGARLGMPALRIQNDAVGATSMETVPKRAYQHTQASSPSEFDVYLLSFSLNDVAHYAFGAEFSCVFIAIAL